MLVTPQLLLIRLSVYTSSSLDIIDELSLKLSLFIKLTLYSNIRFLSVLYFDSNIYLYIYVIICYYILYDQPIRTNAKIRFNYVRIDAINK